jgi:hypothetical protein
VLRPKNVSTTILSGSLLNVTLPVLHRQLDVLVLHDAAILSLSAGWRSKLRR